MNRRQMLIVGAGTPAALSVLAVLQGCQDAETVACVDPDELTLAEGSFRESVNYVARSSHPEEICSACSFYSPGVNGSACGVCQMFDQGPVHSAGRCDSWSAA